jgi:hypothetical protein
MEFADRRAHKVQADWWKVACGPANTLDTSCLLAHTDAASVELLETELHRCLLRQRCSACGINFTFGTSLGQWQCRDHTTGQPRDHHRIEETDVYCGPQDVTFVSWHYELLLHIGALSSCIVPGRIATQISGQTEQVCIRRSKDK